METSCHVVGLYLHLLLIVVLPYVNEEITFHALGRLQLLLHMFLACVQVGVHEKFHCGVKMLFAALDVAAGEVIAE
jgi:hypothetical protein